MSLVELPQISEAPDVLQGQVRRLVEMHDWKAGDLFMAVRVAITGRTATPPLFDTMVALGYERSQARLDRAIEKLDARGG